MVVFRGRSRRSLRGLWILVVALSLAVAPSGAQAGPGRDLGTDRTIGTGATTSATAQADCPGGEIYDDGVAENGYSGNPAVVDSFEAVQQFTPAAYPASYGTECVGLVSLGGPDLDFEIQVRDDDGPGGTPGTLLGALPVSVTDLPGGLPCTFYEFDISGLGLNIPSGSVFIGVRWNPMTFPSRFICADESPTTPLHPSFINLNQGAGYQPAQDIFPNYRALLVRAVKAQKTVKDVVLKAKPKKVKAGKKTTLTATVAPCAGHEGDLVELQMKKKGGAWRSRGSIASDGICQAVFKQKVRKVTRFRALSPEQDGDHLAGMSEVVKVRIKKKK